MSAFKVFSKSEVTEMLSVCESLRVDAGTRLHSLTMPDAAAADPDYSESLSGTRAPKSATLAVLRSYVRVQKELGLRDALQRTTAGRELALVLDAPAAKHSASGTSAAPTTALGCRAPNIPPRPTPIAQTLQGVGTWAGKLVFRIIVRSQVLSALAVVLMSLVIIAFCMYPELLIEQFLWTARAVIGHGVRVVAHAARRTAWHTYGASVEVVHGAFEAAAVPLHNASIPTPDGMSAWSLFLAMTLRRHLR